ncbi:unnamed protein product [Paramecium octaurelia]|uniref:Uncharacterized protein n=1 Tax=Paramecium octaurelia TaxID=43137 RepID=A0A8S1VKH9_PAROT|nr:unnamed protein product [Paramecium octaurelia]
MNKLRILQKSIEKQIKNVTFQYLRNSSATAKLILLLDDFKISWKSGIHDAQQINEIIKILNKFRKNFRNNNDQAFSKNKNDRKQKSIMRGTNLQ